MASINTFDRSLKVIARNHADLFLQLVLPGVPLTLVNQPENVELSLPVQPVDFVHRILHQEQEQLLHLEFQLDHFADFPWRMCHLHGGLTQQFKLPVLSFAICLRYRQAPTPNEYTAQIGERVVNRFSYPVIKLWDYADQIRSGQLRELAPLLVMLEEEPDEGTLQIERELILAEPDPAKRGDLLAIALTFAARHFDREFLWRLFREELVQMEHASIIDEWLDEAVQKAVLEAQREAHQETRRQLQGRAIACIIRVLTIRFSISEMQKAAIVEKLNQIDDLSLLDTVEERALQSFTFANFETTLDTLLPIQPTNGSIQ